MTVELKKGYIIDSYYDKNTRSYITTLKDNEGNQIRDAYYSGNMTDRNADVQHLKEFFYEYMNEALDLKKSIKDTKEKTKKSKLPALSTLSPIMPDAAAGIDTFNSGVGLSEEWVHRDELESKLKKMGFKYNFARYTDEQLYRIYQERLKYLEKKHKEKEKKKQQENEAENKRINSKDSFMKNGIEFESEDAAKEYFGESMNNKFYLNDMLASYDIEDNEIKQSLNENLNTKNNFRTITEGLKYFEKKEFSSTGNDAQLEVLYESIKDKLDKEDIQKLGNFLKKANDADEVNIYIKGLLSEGLEDKIHISYRKSGYGGFTKDGDDINLSSYSEKFDEIEGDPNSSYAAILLKSTISHSDYYKLIFSDDVSKLNRIIIDWLYNSSLSKDPWIDIHRYGMLIDIKNNKEIAHGDTWANEEKITAGWDKYSLVESLEEAYTGSIEDISIEEIEPQQKDYDRAKGLKFRGHTFRGNGQPFGSEASKMAKLIKDPIKLVRRAKAVVATYGADEGYMSNNGWYHHVAPDEDTDVWGPFRDRLVEFGFTRDQIDSIRNFKPLKESLNEDWESGDPSIAEMIAEDILIGAEEEYSIDALVYAIDYNEENDVANIAIEVDGPYQTQEDFLYFIDEYFKPPVPENIEELVNIYEDEVDEDRIIYTLKVKFKNENKMLSISKEEFDKLLQDLLNRLAKVGFIIDENSSGITDNIMGGKHIQVINPNMFYPTSESEGEELTDKEAYQLFRDDLREVEGILDTFEDEHNKVLYITFNFGPNKNMVITGGIDIHLFKELK